MSEYNDDVVISFKPHTGYDSPLVAMKGASVAEALDKVKAFTDSGGFAVVGLADVQCKAQFEAARGLGAQPTAPPSDAWATPPATQPATTAPPASPAAAPQGQASGAEVKTCPHSAQYGPKKYTTNKPNAAKKWAAWMCPAPKGTPDQCDPDWDNNYK